MDLRQRIIIQCPPDVVAEMLTHRPDSWLGPFLRIAGTAGNAAGNRLRASLGRPPLPDQPTKTVGIRVGDVEDDDERTSDQIRIPFHWEAEGFGALFRFFDGAFVLKSEPDEATSLMLEGDYEPGNWYEGDLTDRLVATAAASGSANSFLVNLRAAVEEALRVGSLREVGQA